MINLINKQNNTQLDNQNTNAGPVDLPLFIIRKLNQRIEKLNHLVDNIANSSNLSSSACERTDICHLNHGSCKIRFKF